MRATFLIAVAFAVVLVGCAAPTTQRVSVTTQQTAVEAQKQMDLLAEDLVGDRARLHRVHWQIATNSTPLCPKLTRLSGFDVMVLPKGDIALSLSRLFGVTSQPTVLAVVPDSPADKAGVKPGDVVLSLWGLPTNDQNQDAIRQRSRAARAGEPMPVQVRRNGEALNIALEPVLACDYPAVLMPEQVLNAYADGERIFMTRGMMGFARMDEELALVLAHEMAHNTMRHMDAKKTNAAVGLAADVALTILSKGAYRSSSISDAAGQAYSQEFEAEADYVGLYMLANSGYSVQQAPKFWRRMATANPNSIRGTHTATHPSTSYRMVALEEAAKEIEMKRSASASLVPIRKDGKPFVAGDGLLIASAGRPLTARSAANAHLATRGGSLPDGRPMTTSVPREVVGCVPMGTRPGDRIELRDLGEVEVKSLANSNTECGLNGPTMGTITC